MAQANQLPQLVRGHFLHPHHPLARTHMDTSFTCDGCWTSGKGTRYRCDPCDFDLHIYCAHCPPTVLSPLHPQHELILVRKLCGLCSKFVDGPKFYRCYRCQMDFHYSCLRIKGDGPGDLSSPLHQHELSRLKNGRCDECREKPIKGIFYRCRDCNFDLHPLCHRRTMLTDSGSSASSRVLPPPASGPKLYFFMHPEHELIFAERSQIPPDSAEELRSRWCAVCSGMAEGNCYMCMPCGFRVHRECANSIKPAVRDEAHTAHALHYLKSKPAPCVVCKESCIAWRYHCSICYVHIHKDCLKGPSPPSFDELGVIQSLHDLSLYQPK